MTDDRLRAAARAYISARNAEEATKQILEAAKAARAKAAGKVGDARVPLVAEIISEARAGVRQRDIMARLDGAYTRERVRQICRSAGISPVE
jgi:hypothetical protein